MEQRWRGHAGCAGGRTRHPCRGCGCASIDCGTPSPRDRPPCVALQTVPDLLAALEAVWAAQPDCGEPASCVQRLAVASPAGDIASPSSGAGCKRRWDGVTATDSRTSSACGLHTPAAWAAASAAPACSVCSSSGGGRSEAASSPTKRPYRRPSPQGLEPVLQLSPAALAAAAEAAAADDLPFFSEEELQLIEECLLPGKPWEPADAASAVGPSHAADDQGDEADSAARPCRAAPAGAGAVHSGCAAAVLYVACPPEAIAALLSAPDPSSRYIFV